MFDGISCGRLALERAEVNVTNYFASEIDAHAIQISKKHYPDIVQLGDVTKWREWDLPKIDLLIGGSPCQGFSRVGRQLNFNDPRSKLFFEFNDILHSYKPKYFLLENVKMKKEYQDIISEHLGVEPIEINSSLVSAQNRPRLYWTNIPIHSLPQDKGVLLKDIIDYSFKGLKLSEKALEYMNRSSPKWAGGKRRMDVYDNKLNEKSKCLTANMYKGVPYGVVSELNRRLSPLECERLQTLPDNYTEGVSNTHRYRVLGNAWTVDVIAHIFKSIK